MPSGSLCGTVYGIGYNQSTLVGGMQLGDIHTVYDFANYGFKDLMLVQAKSDAAADLSANAALKFTSKGVVDMLAGGGGEICSAVNDVSSVGNGTSTAGVGTGVIVTKGNYFFATIRGTCKPLVDNGVAKGPLQTTSATAGSLAAWATDAGATFKQTNLYSLATSVGGATVCQLNV